MAFAIKALWLSSYTETEFKVTMQVNKQEIFCRIFFVAYSCSHFLTQSLTWPFKNSSPCNIPNAFQEVSFKEAEDYSDSCVT